MLNAGAYTTGNIIKFTDAELVRIAGNYFDGKKGCVPLSSA